MCPGEMCSTNARCSLFLSVSAVACSAIRWRCAVHPSCSAQQQECVGHQQARGTARCMQDEKPPRQAACLPAAGGGGPAVPRSAGGAPPGLSRIGCSRSTWLSASTADSSEYFSPVSCEGVSEQEDRVRETRFIQGRGHTTPYHTTPQHHTPHHTYHVTTHHHPPPPAHHCPGRRGAAPAAASAPGWCPGSHSQWPPCCTAGRQPGEAGHSKVQAALETR